MTTTVNIANIKVGMNVKELKDSGEFARHELARLTKMFKDAETGTQKFENDLELLQRAFVSSGGAIKNYEQIVGMLEEKHGLAAQSAKELAAEEAKLAHAIRAAGLGIKENAALFSGEQLDKLAKVSERTMSPLQHLHREVQALDRAFELGKMDIQVYNNLLSGLEKQYGLTAIHAKKAADAELARAHAQRAAGLGITSGAAGFSTEDLDAIAKMAKQAGGPIEDLKNKVALLDKAFASGMSEDAYNATLKHLIDSSGIYAEQTKKAAEEQDRLNKLIESVRTPFEKYSEELKYVNEQLAAGKVDAMQHAAAVQNLAKRYGEFHPVLAATAAKIPTSKMGLFSNDELKALGRFDIQSAKPSTASTEFLQQNMALTKALKTGAYTADQYDAALADLHKRFGILALAESDLISKEEKTARLKREAIANSQNLAAQTQATGMSMNGLAARFVGLNEVVQLAKRGIREFVDFMKESVQIASKIETASISFEVLTKSAEGSTQIMKQLRDLAKSTPIAFSDFAQATKMMLGTRVAADQIKPTLSALAAISLGNTETFAGLAKAFSDVSAAGRLTGQEMLQFRNAGFNPLNEIARTTGKSMRQLKLDMEEGRISFDVLAGSILSVVGAGGLFEGMNERLMGTTQGQFNQLKNAFQEMQITIGNTILPAVREVTLALKEMFNPGDPGILLSTLQNFSSGIGSISAFLRGGSEGLGRFMFEMEEAHLKASMAKFKTNFTARKNAKEQAKENKELTDEEIKLIKQKTDAFKESLKKISDENLKAKLSNPYDPDGFEKYMLMQDEFGKTLLQQLESQKAIIQLSETRRLEEVNAALQQSKAMQETLAVEERVVQLKKTSTLMSQSQLKDYATAQIMFEKQVAEEKKSHQAKKELLTKQKDAGAFFKQGQSANEESRAYFSAMDEEDARHKKRIKDLQSAMSQTLDDVFSKTKMELRSAANELTKKFNPTANLRQELAQLDFMRQQNMITQQVFDKQAMELGQQAKEAMGLLPNIAPALKEGSAEAYKFILEQNTKSQERFQIKKLNEEMLKELRTANQQNANAPRLAQAR